MPEELSKRLQELATPRGEALLLVLFATAFTPAVAEELLCRGALTRSLRAVLGPVSAVVVSAALFGILHMSAFRFLPTFLLGTVLGAATLATGSVIPAMISHFLNNAGIIIVSRFPGVQAGWERAALPIGFVALGVVLMGGTLLFGRARWGGGPR
jgi:membrane protease YdiL (CAAX protease family)